MPFTEHSDIYVAVHDAGINRVVRHVVRQRPSLVNLGTAALVRQPERLCREIDAHPVVSLRRNPLVGEVAPLPVALTPFTLGWGVQVSALELDVHPGDVVTLPPQLQPPLGEQRLALHGGVCFGFGCPPDGLVDDLPPGLGTVDPTHGRRASSMIPSRELLCTCLDLSTTLGLDFVGPQGSQRLRATLGGLELVDLGPESLENSIECYAELVLRLGLLPRLEVPVIQFSNVSGALSLAVEPTATSGALPHNPALEDDQAKVFLDLTVGPGVSSGGGDGGGSGGGGSSPPPDPGSPRARARNGTFDATAALAEDAVAALFNQLRDGFSQSASGSADLGPFSASYAAEVHLENGTIDMRPDGTIAVSELDVAFGTLELCLGLDIPEICVGGFCIIGIPFDGCAVRAPEICLFDDDPDIELCLDIGPFLRTELSAALRPLVKYAPNPARGAAMNDWDAVEAGVANHWQLYVDPVSIDIDLFDVADIVGGLLEDAVDAVLDTILGPLPGWAKDLIRAILGPVIDLIRGILDLGDDIEEWISDTLGVSLGLFDFLLTLVGDYLAEGRPLAEIPDPLTLVPADGGLIPVLVPMEYLGVRVDDAEMVIEVDLGD